MIGNGVTFLKWSVVLFLLGCGKHAVNTFKIWYVCTHTNEGNEAIIEAIVGIELPE